MAKPRNLDREQKNGPGGPLYATWSEGDKQGRALAMYQASGGDADAGVVARGAYFDLGGDVSVRQGSDRRDYASFRPGEGKPRRPRDIIAACLRAYDEFSVVRNIIDTMGDFAVQGASLSHPNPRVEKFYQEWFYKVRGPDVSEHVANTLFLCANAPVRRHTARLKVKDAQDLRRGFAAEKFPGPFSLAKREIPIRYTVLNPVQVVVLGGDLVPFLGPDAFTYAVEIPVSLMGQLQRPRTDAERKLLSRLPEAVRKSIEDGVNVIPLNSENVRVLHYKRRDWEVWAKPMTYSLLDDLAMLRKLKLADLSALDGAISHIRVWKLGSLEHRMMPTPRAVQKLADMLANAGNGVSMDLIWGPDLELKETNTEVYKFLGEAKYAPVLAAIFAGYGIPPTLIGASVTGGMTNNFISLKTMTERLQYVRRVVREFWEYEVSLVQQAMGFRQPASVRFDRMVLTDEASEKALLIQMIDRDLLSARTVQERFGEDPAIEQARLRQEDRLRKGRKMPAKAGAFHNGLAEHDMTKTFALQGLLSPSQAGLDVPEKKPGEKDLLERQDSAAQKARKQQNAHDLSTQELQLKHGAHPNQVGKLPQKGQPGQGRPRNKKDSQKRKQKVVKVRTKAALIGALAWAEDALRAVARVATPAYLGSLGKANLRKLTDEEAADFERLKFAALVCLPPGGPADDEAVKGALSSPLRVPPAAEALLRATLESHRRQHGEEPAADKVREYMAKVAALNAIDPSGV